MTTNHDTENRSDSSTSTDSHGSSQRPSYDDVNVPVVVLVGVISMVLTFVTIWFVEGVYYQWRDGLSPLVLTRSYERSNTINDELIAGQEKKLMGVPELGIESVESVMDGVVSKYMNDHANQHGDEADEKDNHNGGGDDH